MRASEQKADGNNVLPSGAEFHGHERSCGVSVKLKHDKTFTLLENLGELKEHLVANADCGGFPTLSVEGEDLFFKLEDGSFTIYPVKQQICMSPFRGCIVRSLNKDDDYVTLVHPKFDTQFLIQIAAYNASIEAYEESKNLNDGVDFRLVEVLALIKRIKEKMYVLYEKDLIKEHHLGEGHEFFDEVIQDLKGIKGQFNSTARKHLAKM